MRLHATALLAAALSALFAVGCAGEDTSEEDQATDEAAITNVPPRSGPTCSAARGEDVVGRYQKALHDIVAFAEGTQDYSNDGYDVLFSHRLFTNCGSHPNICVPFRRGNTCSTAAGRYQFLKRTWDGAARARGLTSFEPESQEVAMTYLVRAWGVVVPQNRPMTVSEFSNAMVKMSPGWASLPNANYPNQRPQHTTSQLRARYCAAAGC
jgi:muramidase (phage lysozyme)